MLYVALIWDLPIKQHAFVSYYGLNGALLLDAQGDALQVGIVARRL